MPECYPQWLLIKSRNNFKKPPTRPTRFRNPVFNNRLSLENKVTRVMPVTDKVWERESHALCLCLLANQVLLELDPTHKSTLFIKIVGK